MATSKQSQTAKRNVKKAQKAARSKRTIASMPKKTRHDLGVEGSKARRRGGRAGHSYDDRSRQELYEVAKQKGIPGRSRMGKSELIDALRSA